MSLSNEKIERLREYLDENIDDERYHDFDKKESRWIDVYPEFDCIQNVEEYHNQIGLNMCEKVGNKYNDIFVSLDYKEAREMAKFILELCDRAEEVENIIKGE